MNERFLTKCVALAAGALFTVACESATNAVMAPSAVFVGASAANADGSTLKAGAPLALSPLMEQTNTSTQPVLAAKGATTSYTRGATLSHRFQVSDADSFDNIVSSGTGASDAAGITRWTVETTLTANKRYVWRVRAELADAFGPWSNVMAFTTAGGGGTSAPTGPTASGPRTPDPAPGTRLPLPDMRGVLAQFSDASQSCPRGLKYVNNPWQDRVIDAFRMVDTRWGYNGKPTRTAADNGGVPVVAAGDEAAYHYGAGPDQGSYDVHLVDMLGGHCGNPSLTWRVFTGEEPGFWTGAGRF
jgi:hypothetical protein